MLIYFYSVLFSTFSFLSLILPELRYTEVQHEIDKLHCTHVSFNDVFTEKLLDEQVNVARSFETIARILRHPEDATHRKRHGTVFERGATLRCSVDNTKAIVSRWQVQNAVLS